MIFCHPIFFFLTKKKHLHGFVGFFLNKKNIKKYKDGQ